MTKGRGKSAKIVAAGEELPHCAHLPRGQSLRAEASSRISRAAKGTAAFGQQKLAAAVVKRVEKEEQRKRENSVQC